jgi:elongation factor 1-alpha
MNTQDDEIIPSHNIIPLFKLSCKTGFGLEGFKKYISKLPKKLDIKLDMILSLPPSISQKKKSDDYIFYIEKVYCPPGIGWVVTGIVRCINPEGFINSNTSCYLGPNNDLTQLKIWSMHNYYQEKIDKLYNGQRGCLALRSDKKLSYLFFRKGTILTNNLDILKKATYKYKAEIKLLSHPSNVRDNFSPVIHCATIRQTASIKIIEIKTKIKKDEDGKCIYPGDTAIIQIEFKFKPEIIEPKQSFFLREGLTLGVGTILEPVY